MAANRACCVRVLTLSGVLRTKGVETVIAPEKSQAGCSAHYAIGGENREKEREERKIREEDKRV